MASWNDIFESIQSLNALEKIKKEFFDEYYKYTNRNLLYIFRVGNKKLAFVVHILLMMMIEMDL